MQAGVTDVVRHAVQTAVMRLGHMRWFAFALVTAGLLAGCTPSSGGGGHGRATSTTSTTTTTTVPCPDPEGDSTILAHYLHTLATPPNTPTAVGGAAQVWQICPGDVDWFEYDPLETSTNPSSVFQTQVMVGGYSAGQTVQNQFAVEIHLDSPTGPLLAPLQAASTNPTISGMSSFPGQPNMPMRPVYLKVSAGPLTVAGSYVIIATGTQA
jgi:hypothetical protein